MSEVRGKQDEMMRLFDVLETIRPEGKKRLGHDGPPPHGKGHGPHGRGHGPHGHGTRGEEHGCCERGHGRGEKHHGECGCKQKPDDGIHMPPSARKLLCVLLREGSLNQRNIANMTNVTAQAVSEMIKKLEHKELIQKESGEINNENIISLTEKGMEIANKLEAQAQEYAEKLFAGFTEEEMKSLHNLIEKLYENKSKMSDN